MSFISSNEPALNIFVVLIIRYKTSAKIGWENKKVPLRGIYTGKVFILKPLSTVTSNRQHYTYIGHLGWRNTNRNDPIYVTSSKVVMAGTVLSIVCHCCQRFWNKNFASVNESLRLTCICSEESFGEVNKAKLLKSNASPISKLDCQF